VFSSCGLKIKITEYEPFSDSETSTLATIFEKNTLSLDDKTTVVRVLDKIDATTLLGQLKGILASTLLKNDSMVKNFMTQSIQKAPIEIVLNRKNQIERYISKKKLKNVLYLLQNKVRDEKLLKIYFLFLNEYLSDEYKRELDLESYADFSLSEVRNIIKSPLYGVDLISFWMPYFFKRSSFKEATLEFSSISKRLSRKTIKDNWWVFSYYVLTDEQFYRSFISVLKERLPLQSNLETYLYFKMQVNPKMKKALSDLKIYNQTGLFKQKRKFFLSLLTNQDSKDFAIYNLYLLGDLKVSYLKEIKKNEP
jgi:hypothetical protein